MDRTSPTAISRKPTCETFQLARLLSPIAASSALTFERLIYPGAASEIRTRVMKLADAI
jgi:hypothetical protein